MDIITTLGARLTVIIFKRDPLCMHGSVPHEGLTDILTLISFT